MTTVFDSFCESRLGAFIESPMGVRGCKVAIFDTCDATNGVTWKYPVNVSRSYPCLVPSRDGGGDNRIHSFRGGRTSASITPTIWVSPVAFDIHNADCRVEDALHLIYRARSLDGINRGTLSISVHLDVSGGNDHTISFSGSGHLRRIIVMHAGFFNNPGTRVAIPRIGFAGSGVIDAGSHVRVTSDVVEVFLSGSESWPATEGSGVVASTAVQRVVSNGGGGSVGDAIGPTSRYVAVIPRGGNWPPPVEGVDYLFDC